MKQALGCLAIGLGFHALVVASFFIGGPALAGLLYCGGIIAFIALGPKSAEDLRRY